MGDLCTGLVYLCTCCCFCSSSDPGSDGSGLCSGLHNNKTNRDPRERALDEEFMQRKYRKDRASGRIYVDQPSRSTLMTTSQQPSADGKAASGALTPGSGDDLGPSPEHYPPM
ncbi:hypothetical protein FB45DRAFT_1059819 [Roridomyces roridus]|uniref:Uncharacterized protein n=1 Tax=Roridomyces roridus TaxID=1738132 RepID=A0AAD7BPD5_9AGAR|nr:hypothetical protein FB45DRAFT_1059819 [Roridomyces roridus]